MAITVSWVDDEQTVLLMNFQGEWNNDELRSTGIQAILMVRSTNHPVYVLSDYTASETAPLGVLMQARDLNAMRPPNWAGGVTITQDLFLKGLLEVFVHIYMLRRHQRNQYVADTYAEALELVARLKKENRVS
jgi:hypothetical protein